MKTAQEILHKRGGIIVDDEVADRYYSETDIISAMKEYADQFRKLENSTAKQIFDAGVSEGMSRASSFEWGAKRKDIEFEEWYDNGNVIFYGNAPHPLEKK